MAFLGLPDGTLTYSPQYEDAVLNAADRWDFSWNTVRVGMDYVDVFEDALKIDGVRINASADLLNRIAEAVGGQMLTPEVSDAIWNDATSHVPPHPQTPNSTVGGMILNSAYVDGYAPRGIVADAGKDWVLSSKGIANYGWHLPSADWGHAHGLPVNDAVTPGLHVVQPVFTGHGTRFADYSQVVRLWRPATGKTAMVAGLALAAAGFVAALAVVSTR